MNGVEYHRLTSYERFRLKRDDSVRGGRPDFFKTYPDVPLVRLPKSIDFPRINFWDVVVGQNRYSEFSGSSLDAMSILFYLSYGITAIDRSGFFAFRSVPSAGALYPCELYGWIGGISEIENGVYHYNSKEHVLEQLGCHKEASNFLELWISAIPYRSAWKYGTRAFRYVLLDAGHLLEQVRIAAKIMGWKPYLCLGFDNAGEASYVLGIDEEQESLMGHVVIKPAAGIDKLVLNVDRDSLKKRSKAAKGADFGEGIRRVLKYTLGEPCFRDKNESESVQIDMSPVDAVSVIVNRRSRRNFIPSKIKKAEFEMFLTAFRQISFPSSIMLYFVVEQVEGIDPGVYSYNPNMNGFSLKVVKEGPTLRRLASACLDQMWIGNAAFAIVIMIDPEKIKSDGDFGYKSSMLSAGRIGQVAYLISEALGYGCCGVGALYDNEVSDIVNMPFGLVSYVLACGRVKKKL